MRRGSIIGVLLLVSWALTGVTMAQSPTGSEPRAAEGQKPLTPEEYARVLAKVLPNEGYTLPIAWADLGPKLVRHGVTDLGKFKQLYAQAEPIGGHERHDGDGPVDARRDPMLGMVRMMERMSMMGQMSGMMGSTRPQPTQ